MPEITEIDQALVELTANAASPDSPGEEGARRCGVYLAALSAAHRAAVGGDESIADRRLRRLSEFPAVAFADLAVDVAVVLPKLDKVRRGAYHRQAIADALNGLSIPARFTPRERAAFLAAYMFQSCQMRPAKGATATETEEKNDTDHPVGNADTDTNLGTGNGLTGPLIEDEE